MILSMRSVTNSFRELRTISQAISPENWLQNPCDRIEHVASASASHCASRVDILEAYQVGGAAVKAADEGDSGKMVVLQRLSDDPYQCGTEVKDVHKIANDEKVVPREWVTEDGSYVTDDFVSYVRPLIQGDVSPVMVDGIPRHLYRKN